MKPLTRVEARQQRKRGNYVAVIAALFAALTLGTVVTAFALLSADLKAANQARDALARQVQGLGAKPVAGPPGSRGKAGESIVGETGPPGPPGPPGAMGASGKPAPTITPSPGPSGAQGPVGQAGADSVVPGPTGPPGKDATGAPGKDGTDGRDGAPPVEWTYVDPAGGTYRCVRVDGFDPENPRYRCTLAGVSSTSTPGAGLRSRGQG